MLEAEKAEIEAALSSGELQGSDLIEKSNRIGALMSELDEKTMRWLELSELA
jgi:ATP-binding cassette subfamily F protein uup